MSATVLDAGVLIGFVNPPDAHHEAAVQAIKDLVAAREKLVVSAITLAEVLVGPLRHGPGAAADVKSSIVSLPQLSVEPVDVPTAERLALIRSRDTRLAIPDAVVVATAQIFGASRILTTDHDFDHVVGAERLADFVT